MLERWKWTTHTSTHSLECVHVIMANNRSSWCFQSLKGQYRMYICFVSPPNMFNRHVMWTTITVHDRLVWELAQVCCGYFIFRKNENIFSFNNSFVVINDGQCDQKFMRRSQVVCATISKLQYSLWIKN